MMSEEKKFKKTENKMQKEEGILTSVSNRDERYLEEKDRGAWRERERERKRKEKGIVFTRNSEIREKETKREREREREGGGAQGGEEFYAIPVTVICTSLMSCSPSLGMP